MGIDLAQISEQHFSVAVRGWNRDEVRDFLREVAASFVSLLQERDKLRRLEAAPCCKSATSSGAWRRHTARSLTG